MSKLNSTSKAKGDNKKSLIGKVIAAFAESRGAQYNYKQMAKLLNISDDATRKLLNKTMTELAESGELEEVSRGKFRQKIKAAYIEGTVDMTSSGAAYIVSEQCDQDVYVSANNLNHALPGDTVRVYVYSRRGHKSVEGEVVDIIKRKRTTFVGTIEVSKNFAFLIPDRAQMPFDIFIPLDKLNKAKNKQKAVVKITEWTERQKNPIGEVVEVLGVAGQNNTEMHAILAEYGLPYKFPERVETAANNIDGEITTEEIARRRDFRNVTTFTIDPADAKDFDDALSFQRLDNGNVQVGIHIADVTHYVRPNTVLESEAYNRATSVYLVDRVVPMLPECLSNDLCSLRPDEEKLCFSAVFELDNEANLINEWFGRTIIKSNRRFSYEEAQAVIETGEGDLKDEILELNRLAQLLRKERFTNGSISFERAEVKFVLDENARPVGVYTKENKESNKLIEEFMLLANKRVATFIGKKEPGKKPNTFVYRIHDQPNPDKLMAFASFIRKFGHQLQIKNKSKLAKSINTLLTEVRGHAEQTVVETLAVRSMAKAEYSTKNVGHYGLGFEYYTHFTSPIRRYPDMMVHRLLAHYLDGGKSVDSTVYEGMCKHSSEMEQLAASAERASIKYKQVEFMKDNVGRIFEGVVSGVTQWGIYVEVKENRCEGMVSVRSLTDDFYEYDENEFAVIGHRSKKRYTLGDTVFIRVLSADMEKKQLNFEMVNGEDAK